MLRNARHNAAIAWVRLPISVVVSGFLFVFVSAPIGWGWLAVVGLIESYAWSVRNRLLAGDVRAGTPHLFGIGLVSIAWVVLALMLWSSGHQVARIAAVVTLLSTASYGVAGGYKSLPILAVLVTPPLTALLAILTHLAWSTQEIWPAALTTFATLGACMSIGLTGLALHRSDRGLEQANADLRALTQRLTLLADRERVASLAKDVFLASVSHELRTPLNGIVGLTAALQRSDLKAADRSAVQIIRDSGEMLERLISDLLDFAAIEAGQLKLRADPFDPTAIVRSAVVLMEAEARRKGLFLVLNVAPDAPGPLIGDGVRVRQIVLNLLSNAIKFTEKGGVTINVGRDPAAGSDEAKVSLMLSVSDTGTGFDLAFHEKLFERFERGQQPTRYGNDGFGLGLAITRALVSAMGGAIRVCSRQDVGSTFDVVLPLERTTEGADRVLDDGSASLAVLSEVSTTRPLRILLAEDHPINRRVVLAFLEPLKVDVDVCMNGAEAVDAASRTRFDLILMDLLMPVMDGLEATRAIRRHEMQLSLPPAPIIMLTASALPAQAKLAIEAGCDAHLAKPVTPARLFEAMAGVLPHPDGSRD